MHKKIVWLLVSGLMVLSLVLSSCAPAAAPATPTSPTAPATPTTPTAPATPTTPATPASEVPKYGGEFIYPLLVNIPGWDDFFLVASRLQGPMVVFDELLTGDWAKGPAGTGETNWWGMGFYLQFETGALAESWEISDPDTVIFHVRKGVHWALDLKNEASRLVNGREFTADDVAFNLTRVLTNRASVHGATYSSWFESATATDKYTVVVKGKSSVMGTAGVFPILADGIHMYPREIVEKYGSVQDWKVAVGTGPFIVTDFVSGSSATFIRNPNYWRKDPLFPQNQLPYVNSLKWLIIPDASTRLAALRTGKIDAITQLSLDDANTLKKSNPELKWGRQLYNGSISLFLRSDTKPLSDVRVRRALHMSVDFNAIVRDYYDGEAGILYNLVPPTAEFSGASNTLDQLPASTKELFEYNPTKAKQLLAEAGYPNGFTFSALMYQDQVDLMTILAAYFNAIGVKMDLDIKEYSAYLSVRGAHKYQYAEVSTYMAAQVYQGRHFLQGSTLNYAIIDDPYINERINKINSFENITNQAEQDRLTKEYTTYATDQAYLIQTTLRYQYDFWHPWIRNYYGYTGIGSGDTDLRTAVFVWVDQGLKKKLGH